MGLVAFEDHTRDDRLQAARERWNVILAARPDLEPAVELQRQLIGSVVDLTAAIEERPLPRLSLPPGYLAAKLARGVPALAGEPIPVPTPLLKPTLLLLCKQLSSGGAGEVARHIHDEIHEGRIDAASLLTASLRRDQAAIRTGAVHRGLAPDLLWLVAELTVSAFTHVLARSLFRSGSDALSKALTDWEQGYCPACGSWPALAEIDAGRRLLRCSFCATAWELGRPFCIYCGEHDAPFHTLAGVGDGGRSVEVCDTCRGYLKAVTVTSPSPFPLLAITDLETMDLDVNAMERGYTRPPLKEGFGKG